MPIINSNPDESICVTKPAGIITCIQQINEECVRQLNAEVDEYDIQKVMMKGGEHLTCRVYGSGLCDRCHYTGYVGCFFGRINREPVRLVL